MPLIHVGDPAPTVRSCSIMASPDSSQTHSDGFHKMSHKLSLQQLKYKSMPIIKAALGHASMHTAHRQVLEKVWVV